MLSDSCTINQDRELERPYTPEASGAFFQIEARVNDFAEGQEKDMGSLSANTPKADPGYRNNNGRSISGRGRSGCICIYIGQPHAPAETHFQAPHGYRQSLNIASPSIAPQL